MTEPSIAGDLEPPATVDYLGQLGAEQLAQRILAHWRERSVNDHVRVWLEPDFGTWSVRGNLERGLPPRTASCRG